MQQFALRVALPVTDEVAVALDRRLLRRMNCGYLGGAVGLAPNTVARCYRELERDRIIETRGRNGTVVSARDDAAESILQVAANEYAARARELGITPEDALRYARSALGL